MLGQPRAEANLNSWLVWTAYWERFRVLNGCRERQFWSWRKLSFLVCLLQNAALALALARAKANLKSWCLRLVFERIEPVEYAHAYSPRRGLKVSVRASSFVQLRGECMAKRGS